MQKKLKIGGATVNQTPIDWAQNTAHIIRAIQAAQEQDVDVLCLPELCITGYGCEDLFLAEWVLTTAWRELLKILPCVERTMVCIGLPIRVGQSTYNGIAVLQNKTIHGITLKQNLAYDGVHYEPRWFKAWPPGLVKEIQRGGTTVSVGDIIYQCQGITLGLEICEDAWVQRRTANSLLQRGVELILNPSASHFALGKSVKREKMVRESSAMYGCAYVYTNLLGNEAGNMLYGGDIIISYKGVIIQRNTRLTFDTFAVRCAEIDFNSSPLAVPLSAKNTVDYNEEFAQAISLSLFDYLRKSKAKGFVLGLSGGADSACCAIIVVEMIRRASLQLGWATCMQMLGISSANFTEAVRELLTCVYQSTKNSSQETFAAAKELAQSLGSTFYSWPVDEELKSYTTKIENVLGRPITWSVDDIALQNIQARSRTPAIWLLANVKHCILLTTSNRSEGSVGYATMDGDMSGSLAPIAGVDKPFIMQWLRWAEVHLSYKSLHAVNNLLPMAELRPASHKQTDEKDIMPYPLLVAIERLAVYENKSPQEAYDILSATSKSPVLKEAIVKFFTLWAANQWKRERMAPSFHLDDFNIIPKSGCRFPILSGNFRAELDGLK